MIRTILIFYLTNLICFLSWFSVCSFFILIVFIAIFYGLKVILKGSTMSLVLIEFLCLIEACFIVYCLRIRVL